MTDGRHWNDLIGKLTSLFDAGRGMTIRDLAAICGQSPSLVRRLLEEGGVVAVTGDSCVGAPQADLPEALATRYRRGMSTRDLSRVTGLDARVVRKLLREAGEHLPRRRIGPASAEHIAAYRAGATIRQVAAMAGWSYFATRQRLLEAGVVLRSRSGHAKSTTTRSDVSTMDLPSHERTTGGRDVRDRESHGWRQRHVDNRQGPRTRDRPHG